MPPLPISWLRQRPSPPGTRLHLGHGVMVLSALVVMILVNTTSASGEMRVANAQSAAPLPCTARSVAVVVDFSHWNEPAIRVCVPWSATLTGYGLLHAAGFTTAGTVHDGPAFICRIGFPSVRGGTAFPTASPPDNEACVLTPPASAYWSYWHAVPGAGNWSYSQLGAMSYHPRPGSVDVWTFGPTDIGGTSGGPAFSPASVLPSRSSPATTPQAPSGSTVLVPGSAPRRGTNGSGSPGTESDPTPTTTAHGAATVMPTTTGRRSSGSPSTTTTTMLSSVDMGTSESASGTVNVKTVSAAKPSGAPRPSGSPMPTIIAIGVIVAAALAAFLIGRSRRRREPAQR